MSIIKIPNFFIQSLKCVLEVNYLTEFKIKGKKNKANNIIYLYIKLF